MDRQKPMGKASMQATASSSSYFSYPVTHIANSLYRRFTDPATKSIKGQSRNASPSSRSTGPKTSQIRATYSPNHPVFASDHNRTASPYQPPPLTPLDLYVPVPADDDDDYEDASRNRHGSTRSPPTSPVPPAETILSKTLAEEIRLLVPPRLQLAETWKLIYSLDNDGASLHTLYDKCAHPSMGSSRVRLTPACGFVMVVQDGAGSIFGAYLTDAPKPHPSFYGTGECFLWKSSVLPVQKALIAPAPSVSTQKLPGKNQLSEVDLLLLSDLPPPPSADTTTAPINVGRSTTLHPPTGDTTPSIRFKAFPYSGINDYLMFCEPDFFSVGGGDGKYGLWLDSSLEQGVSSAACLTFGNEALSEEGETFDIVGVEVWGLG